MRKFNILVFTLILAGCSSAPYKPYARQVKKKPGMEGIIALKIDHRDEDRSYADTLMQKNCGDKPVNVIEESEVSVGTSTSTISNTKKPDVTTDASDDVNAENEKNNKLQHTTSETISLKEWQISYTCQEAQSTKAETEADSEKDSNTKAKTKKNSSTSDDKDSE